MEPTVPETNPATRFSPENGAKFPKKRQSHMIFRGQLLVLGRVSEK